MPGGMKIRIAKKLCEIAQDDWSVGKKYWSERAAEILTVMREPTEAMLAEGKSSVGGWGFGDTCFEGDPKQVWQAMIDGALL